MTKFMNADMDAIDRKENTTANTEVDLDEDIDPRSPVQKWIERLIIPVGLLIALFVLTQVIQIGFVPSESMYPTLSPGTSLISRRVSMFPDISRGDIVNFYNREMDMMMVKRVIGLPGETISFEDGKVLLNGEVLDETAYLEPGLETEAGYNGYTTFEIPENCYFLMGDNRGNSGDARYWLHPFIDKSDIASVMLLSIDIPFLGALGQL